MTADSVPRMPMEVVAPWLTALKAYSSSACACMIRIEQKYTRLRSELYVDLLTDLIEPSLWREDGNVSIESSATASRHFSPHAMQRGIRVCTFYKRRSFPTK